MIRKLDNTVYENSKLIWKVFQLSYSVEARILNAENLEESSTKLTQCLSQKTAISDDLTACSALKVQHKNT